jgi:hypothetical protein
MGEQVRRLVAKSASFHKLVAELHEDATSAGIASGDYGALFTFLRHNPLFSGTPEASVRRYARVACYVHPAILAQWPMKIARDDLMLLAAMPQEQQLSEYKAMAGVRSVLANRSRASGSAQSYARQVLVALRAGLSTSEIREVLELLTHTNAAEVLAALKEENHHAD